MLTDGNERTANAVAKKLGLDQVETRVETQHKHERVRQLHEQEEIVSTSGDGNNDAHALTAAHVGIAMSTGTDVVMESAGIALVKGAGLSSVSVIANALRLKKQN